MAVKCFFGKTGSGKSFKAGQKMKDYKKKIIFDITPSKTFKGDIDCSDYSQKNLEELMVKLVEKDSFTLVFRPSPNIDLYSIGELVCSFAMRYGNYFDEKFSEVILLVLDELDKYVSTSQKSFIARAIGMGRHSHLDLFCISQVPSQLPKVIRDNASEEYFFQLGLNDYYISKLGGVVAEKLASGGVPNYSYYLKKDGNDPQLFSKRDKAL